MQPTPGQIGDLETQLTNTVKRWVAQTWPTPTPVPAVNASGITPPAVPTGLKLDFFDDFATNVRDTTIWAPSYTGHSEGGVQGRFGGDAHVIQSGDSTLKLLAFSDPTFLAQSWVNEAGKYNNWVGGGLGAWNKPLPVGSEVYVCMKADFHPGFSPIALLMGVGEWGPELDFAELSGDRPTQFTGTRIVGAHGSNNQPQFQSPTLDLTKYHVFGTQWHADKVTYSLSDANGNNVVWALWPNDSTAGDVNGLKGPTKQVLCLQYQTNPYTPPADASITAANPATQTIDWVIAFTP